MLTKFILHIYNQLRQYYIAKKTLCPQKKITAYQMLRFDSSILILVVPTVDALPAANYIFKVNNRNTRTRCQWRRSGVFIENFEHISLLKIDKFAIIHRG